MANSSTGRRGSLGRQATVKRGLSLAGDINASPGSKEWLKAVFVELRKAAHDAELNESKVERLANQIKPHWEKLKDRSGRRYKSWEDFCRRGIDAAKKALKVLLEVEEKGALADTGKKKNEKGYNITLESGRGIIKVTM